MPKIQALRLLQLILLLVAPTFWSAPALAQPADAARIQATLNIERQEWRLERSRLDGQILELERQLQALQRERLQTVEDRDRLAKAQSGGAIQLGIVETQLAEARSATEARLREIEQLQRERDEARAVNAGLQAQVQSLEASAVDDRLALTESRREQERLSQSSGAELTRQRALEAEMSELRRLAAAQATQIHALTVERNAAQSQRDELASRLAERGSSPAPVTRSTSLAPTPEIKPDAGPSAAPAVVPSATAPVAAAATPAVKPATAGADATPGAARAAVTRTAVNLQQSPGLRSPTVGRLGSGVAVTITDSSQKDTGWLRVELPQSSVRGWVPLSSLETAAEFSR